MVGCHRTCRRVDWGFLQLDSPSDVEPSPTGEEKKQMTPQTIEGLESVEGLIIGFVFGLINFWLLVRIVSGLIHSKGVSKGRIALLFSAKLILLSLIIGLILWKRYVSPLPFVGGFTVSLIVGIAVLALISRSERVARPSTSSGCPERDMVSEVEPPK